MTEVMNMAADESIDPRQEGKEKSVEEPHSSPPPPPVRRRERDDKERRDDRDLERPQNRRGDISDRNRSPPLPPPLRERDRDRDYKRRSSHSPPPPYRDRKHSPPRRSSPPPHKRSRRDDGSGFEGRRGSPRGGFGPGDRRFGFDYGGGNERDMRGRLGYADERSMGRFVGRLSGGYQGGPSGK